jgi:uncharacterized integral membrane protein
VANTDASISKGRKVPTHLIAGGVLAAAVLSFVFQNTRRTKLRWLVFTVHAPLWVVLLATAAASLAAGELVAIAIRRARKN